MTASSSSRFSFTEAPLCYALSQTTFFGNLLDLQLTDKVESLAKKLSKNGKSFWKEASENPSWTKKIGYSMASGGCIMASMASYLVGTVVVIIQTVLAILGFFLGLFEHVVFLCSETHRNNFNQAYASKENP